MSEQDHIAVTELLPCPFCGGEPSLSAAMNEYWIVCRGCAASSRMCGTEEYAVKHWNTRATLAKEGVK